MESSPLAAQQQFAPGWYPNPQGPGQRYYDGSQWTDQYQAAPVASAPAKPKESRTVLKVMLGVVLGGIVLIAGCAALVGGAANEAVKQAEQIEVPAAGTSAADKPAAEEGPTFENGVLTTPELKIEVLRHKVIQAGQVGNEYGDKPVIAFWYTTTNLSGGDVNPTDFLFNFNAYQDNNPNAVNELDVGMEPDDRFLDSQLETIKKGGTVESAIAYELDDLDTPVELVATEGLDEVIGKAKYTLR